MRNNIISKRDTNTEVIYENNISALQTISSLSLSNDEINGQFNSLLKKLKNDNITYWELLELWEIVHNTDNIEEQNKLHCIIKKVYQEKNKTLWDIVIDDILTYDESKEHFEKLLAKYWYNTWEFNWYIEHEEDDNKSFISINFPVDHIASIMENWYHSWFMNNASTGAIKFNKRLAIEHKYNFLYKDTVYWSLSYDKNDHIWWWSTLSMNTIWTNDLKPISPYWAPFLKIKKHCTERCTWTLWDTWSENLLLRREDCIKAKKLQKMMRRDKKLTNQFYIDIQVHWGIYLDDIESIEYPLFSLYNENINYDDISILYKYTTDKIPLHINIPSKMYSQHIDEVNRMKILYPKALFIII